MSSTVANRVAENGVVLGFWTNWSQGSIKGATITLTKSSGAFLTAALAVFVTYVGARFWRISCFAVHHWRSSKDPRDALYHQRQALLRNSDSSSGVLAEIFWMIWSWRRKAGLLRVLKRLLPLFALAATLAAGFAVAGVFSSRISSSMGGEVMISSPNCGYLWWDSNFTFTDTDTLINYATQLTVDAAAYAQRCYRGEAATTECPTYVQKSIEGSVTRNATCPFDPKICLLNNDNLVIDTGHFDSHHDLGLNAAPQDRFLYRRVTACAPLRTEGYSEPVNQTMGSFDFPYMTYLYGPNTHTGANYTYDYPMFRPSDISKNAADYTIM